MSASDCVLLAGGGTGGHVYPLVAVADALGSLEPAVTIVFAGTERGLEQRVVPARGYPLVTMPVRPMRGAGKRSLLTGAVSAAVCLPICARILRRHRPRVVLSVGGYAAGPLTLAARVAGIPVALLEPNAIMGFTNRVLSRFVDRGYVAYDDVKTEFRSGRAIRTGVPIRPGFHRRPLRDRSQAIRILVLGGSQGAQALNDVVPDAIARVGRSLEVVHQAGPDKETGLRDRYRRLGIQRCEVIPFIDDMPGALAAAHIVVSRAGAGAVSEICAVGRPSILVPYPYAADDHQQHNAEALQRVGAARLLPARDLSVERLAAELESLVGQDQTLVGMSESAAAQGAPDAARTVALDLLALGGVDGNRGRPAEPVGAKVTYQEVV